ncbi:hypothetical protein FNV43_RR17696 [Rhamnella rubrinervis]|uniref:EF-hand domain-containing protein n=1 Tax=Rhamnella rubrinervis TaxID=2594499 RepID=A0A8K0E278_9ROSA|nr:hypothetical protein FNV43_RR17696 [Rhamnella rubrinervis]
MASFGRYGSQSYAPSAPSLPEEQSYGSGIPPPPATANSYAHQPHSHGHGIGYGQDCSYERSGFSPGTHPDVIRSFQMADSDRSGFIDENELQQALSSGYQRFSLGTIRLLMFLFKNPNEHFRIGPKEFAALWGCLGQWRAIFERFDKDRSGKISLTELRDALYSIGYVIPQPVLQLLISKYDNGGGQRDELNFDSFLECGMIVKGLTEKFKEKDPRYAGTATLSYDTFMSMVIPFIVSYN